MDIKKLKADNFILKQALKIYANKDNWHDIKIEDKINYDKMLFDYENGYEFAIDALNEIEKTN